MTLLPIFAESFNNYSLPLIFSIIRTERSKAYKPEKKLESFLKFVYCLPIYSNNSSRLQTTILQWRLKTVMLPFFKRQQVQYLGPCS